MPHARGELRRLKVRETERRQVLVLGGKLGEQLDDGEQLVAHKHEALANLKQLGIVRHKARGGAEVDDFLCVRAPLAERVHVRHHVVAQLLLLLFGARKVNVVHGRAHLVNDGRRNVGNSEVLEWMW